MNNPLNPLNPMAPAVAPVSMPAAQQGQIPTLFDDPSGGLLQVATTQAGDTDVKLGGMQYPRIKVLQHGIFYLPVGGDKNNPIQIGPTNATAYGVIIGTTKHMTRVCFDKAFDNTGATSPVVICRSRDGSKPDADVADKPSAACASCQYNQKFSAGDGTPAKKCKTKLPALVIPATMQEVNGMMVPQFMNEVCVFTINATSIMGDSFEERSLFNLSMYNQRLEGRGAKLNHVLTTFQLDQRPQSMCKSLFTSSYVLNDNDVATLQQIINNCPYDLDEMLGVGDEDEVEAAPPVPQGNGSEAGSAAVGSLAPVTTTAPAAPPPSPAAQAAPQAQAPAPQAQVSTPPPAPVAQPQAAPAPAPAPAQAAPPPPPAAAPTGVAPPPPPPAVQADVIASQAPGGGQPGPDAVDDPSLSW